MRQGRRGVFLLLGLVVALPLLVSTAETATADRPHWSVARRDSAGLAPDPATTPEAVVQVYAARTHGWRGAVAVHSWIAFKEEGAERYVRFDVVGWRARYGGSVVVRDGWVADAYWAGAEPKLLVDLRGEAAAAAIPRIRAAIESYPHREQYRSWPGPNSNTFTAHIGRAVPELALDLPPTAIGKDYLPNGDVLAKPPGGAGIQLSLFGLAGVTLGIEEGVEFNLLGLALGLDLNPPALRLPGVGRVGM
ncbi:MAG: DUF3750 domain-containing protein [Alphaproteobacteria bacterium]|nr:DUF3750 domain-containing protein [Alphaproteobacteria bacterium]